MKGAIAQLGERVLCKHEVVGSIPSGSTKASRLGEGVASLSGVIEIRVDRPQVGKTRMFEIVKRNQVREAGIHIPR